MAQRKVLSIGQCGPDHQMLSRFITSNFEAELTSAALMRDALDALRKTDFDLVLVNRKLDADYSDGLEIIKKIKADERLKDVPCMLVTNYEEHQRQAIQAGAERGFGKLEYGKPETRERLAAFLR